MKRRLVHAFLVVFTLWPLAQHGLVRRYDVSPWKLAGWGAYAAPRIDPTVQLYVVENGRGRKLSDAELPGDLAADARAYAQRRADLGRWNDAPDTIGAGLLARFPQEGVLVVVQMRHIDPVTRRTVVENEQHLYRPDGTVQRGILRND